MEIFPGAMHRTKSGKSYILSAPFTMPVSCEAAPGVRTTSSPRNDGTAEGERLKERRLQSRSVSCRHAALVNVTCKRGAGDLALGRRGPVVCALVTSRAREFQVARAARVLVSAPPPKRTSSSGISHARIARFQRRRAPSGSTRGACATRISNPRDETLFRHALAPETLFRSLSLPYAQLATMRLNPRSRTLSSN